MLCLLEGELDCTVFHQLMSQFIGYWSTREPDFVKMFEKCYATRACIVHNVKGVTRSNMIIIFTKKWAKCHRFVPTWGHRYQHVFGKVTNCVCICTYVLCILHSFHNKLKTTYMNGKANRRIDFLLDCLLRVELDNYFKYMEKDILLPINHKLTEEDERHSRGMQINADRVKVLGAVMLYLTCMHTPSSSGMWSG